MKPLVVTEMRVASSYVAAARERLHLSAALRPARASGSCIRGLCDSWRNCPAKHAGCGLDGLADAWSRRRDNALRHHRSGRRERSRPAGLCGILADQGKTGAWEARALFSTGWNESTLLILSESFRSGRMREE